MARQSVAQVALWVRDVDVTSCMPGEGALAVPPPLPVRLTAPLGKRKLVNGVTGRPVPQFNARLLLRPRTLPPGYRLRQVIPQLIWPEGHAAVRVELWYSPEAGPGDYILISEYLDDPLVLRPWQFMPEAGPSPVPPSKWARIRIRGVPGWAAPSVIVWGQRGLVYSVSAGPPLTPITTAQLIVIADSAAG